MSRADPRQQKQKDFYHNQRLQAEETGDQGTVDKIYGKLHKTAPKVGGTDRVDNALLGIIPTLADPLALIGRSIFSHVAQSVGEEMFPTVVEQAGGRALGAGRGMLRGAAQESGGVARGAQAAAPKALARGASASRTKPLVKASTVQRISREKNVTPSRPIEQSPQKALQPGRETGPNFVQPKAGKAGTPRMKQTSPRAGGTNPRATGMSKRASSETPKVYAHKSKNGRDFVANITSKGTTKTATGSTRAEAIRNAKAKLGKT